MSYHKSSQQTEERNNTAHTAAANAALAAAQWSHQGQKPQGAESISIQGPYTEEEIERLAEYSVRKETDNILITSILSKVGYLTTKQY